MKERSVKEIHETIEWLITQIEKSHNMDREEVIKIIEKYLEENW